VTFIPLPETCAGRTSTGIASIPIMNVDKTISKSKQKARQIRDYYRVLYRAWGPQHWWPGETPFEVIVGACLVQNTAWANAKLALQGMRSAKVLNVKGVREISLEKLEKIIRPAGFFRQKARCLKNLVVFLDTNYGGSLRRMFARPTRDLRQELLQIKGIGPETADSILLYGGQHPVIVVDTYARRVLARHGIVPMSTSYEGVRALMEQALSPLATEVCNPGKVTALSHRPSAMSMARRTPLAQVYNEMHGLMVAAGKQHCLKSAPRCEGCPLQQFLPQR